MAPMTARSLTICKQVNQRACSRPSSYKSPKVSGFLPINRGQPPANAPTEPRAMRTTNAHPGSSTGSFPVRTHHHAIESAEARPLFASHGLPPAGIRALVSTRPELGLPQPANAVDRAARRDDALLRLMSRPQARANLPSSQSQGRTRVEPAGQFSSAPPSRSGPPQEKPGAACPTSLNPCPPYQITSGQTKGPASQIVHPSGGLPSSSPGGQTDTSRRSESMFPSPSQIGNKSKNSKRQASEQRRGPARPGRIMQTVEQSGLETSLRPSPPPVQNTYPHPYRPATPGPSCLSRAAPTHPQSSPGLFVTPNSPFHIRPFASSPPRSAVSRGKRPRDETEDLDPGARSVEWERMRKRIRNHETEMEETARRLETMSQKIEEQQRRIGDLEQKQRIGELLRELEREDPIEAQEEHAEGHLRLDHKARSQPSQETVQHGRRQKQCRRHEGQRRHDRCIEPEQSETRSGEPETRHLTQQPDEHQGETGQRRRALDTPSPPERNGHRSVTATRPIIENAQSPIQALSDAKKATQRRFKREVLKCALSGHNPKLVFDDNDRPIVSEATAFLLRLSQEVVLDKFKRYIKNKDFFDVNHPSFKSTGCWLISSEACSDYKIKLWNKGEKHTFSFSRLAIRLWHDEESMYSLLQGKTQQKAIPVCHNDNCMNPGHILVEASKEAAERRKCKSRGRCTGHVTVHKDGTVQRRMSCIFPHQPMQ